MKDIYRNLIFTTIIAGGIIVLLLSFAAANYFSGKKDDLADCKPIGIDKNVGLRDGQFRPMHTIADKCDVLNITNYDDQVRLVAFGEHDEHRSYNGVSQKFLKKGETLTVILNKAGDYKFHDHLQAEDEPEATFTVND